MSDDKSASDKGQPSGVPGVRKLNGHANGHAAPSGSSDSKGGPSVVVPFPKKQAQRPSRLAGAVSSLLGTPGRRFGAMFGWLAVIAFAWLFWGIKKDGIVDMVDVFAGLFGVLTALWFHRSR